MLAVGDMGAGAAVVSIQKWDQRFESAFLHRGVGWEPDFRGRIRFKSGMRPKLYREAG
jgi:hypothetical protein